MEAGEKWMLVENQEVSFKCKSRLVLIIIMRAIIIKMMLGMVSKRDGVEDANHVDDHPPCHQRRQPDA